MTTIVFIQMASNWSSLMKKIVNSSLDKYIDVTVQRRCYITTMIMLALAICENLLSQNTKIMNVIYCSADNVSIYETFIEVSFPWFKELNWTVPIPAGILLLFFNVTATLNWSYSDIFIICISLYLASILKKINETMAQVDLRFYHPTFWSNIREDYTRATQLIATFDDNISGLMLISFASNLFFICLQLFHILSHGLQEKTGNKADPCVANEKVYSYLMYFLFSLTFVLGRFLAVSMVAASVNTASKAPGPILYGVPAHAYCNEVQRFIEQVHGGNVALSGLQFFYVTKGLVLTVAGTIVTYELVLLQFNGEDANS
ncbi:gustatory receptor for sugar taste 64f-like [Ostrinia furnacalis]|uniref:gustatory receptor for sugar taste 64f-like n=1 Tax=Ostrinia furnacalis TaxID=93504 RepID=UPI00103FE593|nr:gustatory receptor for sugar taste 64f-like [Ostrinia furnacalis]